jgi:hypothetical protein
MRYALIVLLACGLALAGCNGKPFGYFDQSSFTPSPYQAKVSDFGGFVGSCASEENFPYYWECMSENAGGENGEGDGSE